MIINEIMSKINYHTHALSKLVTKLILITIIKIW